MTKRIDHRLRKVKQAIEAITKASDPEAYGCYIREVIVAALDEPDLLERMRDERLAASESPSHAVG